MSTFRAFSGINENLIEIEQNINRKDDFDRTQLIKVIREDIIGTLNVTSGPFGKKPIIYADWTASGRGMRKIESFLQYEVLPLYGVLFFIMSKIIIIF